MHTGDGWVSCKVLRKLKQIPLYYIGTAKINQIGTQCQNTAKFVHFSKKNFLKKNNNSLTLICLLLFPICVVFRTKIIKQDTILLFRICFIFHSGAWVSLSTIQKTQANTHGILSLPTSSTWEGVRKESLRCGPGEERFGFRAATNGNTGTCSIYNINSNRCRRRFVGKYQGPIQWMIPYCSF